MSKPLQSLSEFIGQTESIRQLIRQSQGSQARREPFPHIALIGPSGVGKTEIARALAGEHGTQLIQLPGYITPPELARAIQQANAHDIVFIDESHNLKLPAQETLYRVIDDLKAPAWSADGSSEEDRSLEEVDVQPITIALATDEPGALRNALLKRIPLKISLRLYDDNELQRIVSRMASGLNLLISPIAAAAIASASHGLPRNVKHHLEKLRYFFSWSEEREIKSADVRKFLSESGIDQCGLGEVEHRYLRHLQSRGSASLESLSLELGMDGKYVRTQIESVLSRQRLILISGKGRQLTPKGEKWLEKQGTNLRAES